jgi:thiol-disulfide isomerase/thioredoxin
MFMREENLRDARKFTTRREMMAGGLCTIAYAAVPGPLFARSFDNPPVFESERHQYTMVEPARAMAPTPLTDLEGKAKTLKPAYGKVTLVSFWATWCINCKADLPAMARLQQVMGSHIDVAAISVDTIGRGDVKSFVSALGIKGLPIYLDPAGLVAGPDASGSSRFPLFGMPITYLIAPDGRIAGYIVGTADWLSKTGQDLLSYYQNS